MFVIKGVFVIKSVFIIKQIRQTVSTNRGVVREMTQNDAASEKVTVKK